MPKINHDVNRFFIPRLGGEKGLKKIKKKYPKWRITSGGLDKTLRRDKILKRHGKEDVKDTAKHLKICKHTVYRNRKRK